MTADERLVLDYIHHNPGTTQALLLHEFAVEFADSRAYGTQRRVSRIIARLRRLKLLRDVKSRCKHCGSALTRGTRNVSLRTTARGGRVVERAWVEVVR